MGNTFEDYAREGFIALLIDIVKNTRSEVKKDQQDKYKKLSIDGLYQIIYLCPEIFNEDTDLLNECITLLEPARTDKVLPVRTAASETLKLLKRLQNENTDESGGVMMMPGRKSLPGSGRKTGTFPSAHMKKESIVSHRKTIDNIPKN